MDSPKPIGDWVVPDPVVSVADFAHLCGLVEALTLFCSEVIQRSSIMVNPNFGESGRGLDNAAIARQLDIDNWRSNSMAFIDNVRDRSQVIRRKYS